MKLEIDAALLATAEGTARRAGALALEMQGSLSQVERKSARDLITEADHACEALILAGIRDAFPDHAVVAEESGRCGDSDYVWYVDPIDGTINYARGLPLWGISVACCRKGEPVAAAIFLPALDQCYVATADTQSLCNDKPIAVSNVSDPEQAIILNSDFNTVVDPERRDRVNADALSARKQQAATFMRSRCLGSAVVESAWVAAGHVDAYQMLKVNAWDIAAGALIVARAGGRVSALDGARWHPGLKNAVVSNGFIHDLLLRNP
jgi:myo-inositol-1(or 4)-monophosphatase